MKKALLTISFGTTYASAERDCIQPVEAALAAAFPDRESRRAYTSKIIVKRLKERGDAVEGEAEALARLRAEGFGDILAVSTHIIHGGEYEMVAKAAADQGVAVTEPLLECDTDLDWMASLLGKLAAEEGRALLVMGHGTEHAADETYVRLRAKLPEGVHLACVEGSHSLAGILPELDAMAEKKLTLMPLMLVAGDHAHNDMAGDEPGSWKSTLEERGFDVRVRMQGLGALPEVQQRFVEKARALCND